MVNLKDMKRVEKSLFHQLSDLKKSLKKQYPERKLKYISDTSDILGSKKRVLILLLLSDRPLGYTELMHHLEHLGYKIVSSEVYKHIMLLDRYDLVKKVGGFSERALPFQATVKGMLYAKKIWDLVDAFDVKEEQV